MNNLEILQEAAIGECHMQSDDYHIMRFNDMAVSISPPVSNGIGYAVMANYEFIAFDLSFAEACDMAAELLK